MRKIWTYEPIDPIILGLLVIGGFLFHPNHDETRPPWAGFKNVEGWKAATMLIDLFKILLSE